MSAVANTASPTIDAAAHRTNAAATTRARCSTRRIAAPRRRLHLAREMFGECADQDLEGGALARRGSRAQLRCTLPGRQLDFERRGPSSKARIDRVRRRRAQL